MYYWWRDSVGTDVHGVVRVAAAFLLPRFGCLPFKNLGLRLFPEGGGGGCGDNAPLRATPLLGCHVSPVMWYCLACVLCIS